MSLSCVMWGIILAPIHEYQNMHTCGAFFFKKLFVGEISWKKKIMMLKKGVAKIVWSLIRLKMLLH